MGDFEKKDIFAVIVAFVLMAYAGFTVWGIYSGNPDAQSRIASAFSSFRTQEPEKETLGGLFAHEMQDPFENLRLQARAAIVIDAETGAVLYEKNPQDQLPLASVTKIMTALVAHERFSATTTVIVPEDVIHEAGLLPYDQWRMKDLIDYSLMISSNDASRAISSYGVPADRNLDGRREVFVQDMNEKAQELGLEQTYFLNESGLDLNESTSGAYGSARDVAMLVRHVLQERPELFTATTLPEKEFYSLLGFAYPAQNTNTIVQAIPGVSASKTGFTDLAGGNLTVAFDAGIGKPLIAVVLGSGKEGRFSDMEQLIWASIYSFVERGEVSK